ncbi:hypothetical protein HAX54_046607, partial [Datura stramonium]|nr:hypothetical protein [Datura stramonium]
KLPSYNEELVLVTHHMSAIIAGTSVEKKGNPGESAIPYRIGRYDCLHACDNDASINLIYLPIYEQSG